MNEEVIIVGYGNVSDEGITLHTNIPARLKTHGGVKTQSWWLSWDKIGENLFADYTKRVEVKDLDELRKAK